MNRNPQTFSIRKGTVADRDRLREIFRDAVLAAGPRAYTADQVAVWAATSEEVDRWDTWMREGSTWVAAEPCEPARAIGVASLWPQDHVHLLYIDPAFHRRGIARALLSRIEAEARQANVYGLTTDASLIAHPVFLNAGFAVVAWDEYAHRGVVFRRARMRKKLR